MIITPQDSEAAGTAALLLAAARNNAEWVAAVCRDGAFSGSVWSSARRTPPLYPDAVSLTPRASAAEVVAGIDTGSPGCSVKDSFAVLDLAPAGFEVLFEARWIHRPAGPPAAVDDVAAGAVRWSEVRTAAELEAWEAAWGGGAGTGLFRAELLARDLVFLAGRSGGRIVAGAVASAGGGVVGVSNLFTADTADTADAADAADGPDAADGSAGSVAAVDAAWAAVLGAVAARWPGLPVVGYEQGADLDAAVRAGFTPIGPLRVWLHTA
ncbi:hypothetical protein ACFV6G_18315 [Streptomyces lavendulae]|uniref:hypothetical protein n=1 Tax=Streptomyces lavendulae TaxID=1914 RepID=UPI0036BD3156